jgi:hypothetical protein
MIPIRLVVLSYYICSIVNYHIIGVLKDTEVDLYRFKAIWQAFLGSSPKLNAIIDVMKVAHPSMVVHETSMFPFEAIEKALLHKLERVGAVRIPSKQALDAVDKVNASIVSAKAIESIKRLASQQKIRSGSTKKTTDTQRKTLFSSMKGKSEKKLGMHSQHDETRDTQIETMTSEPILRKVRRSLSYTNLETTTASSNTNDSNNQTKSTIYIDKTVTPSDFVK